MGALCCCFHVPDVQDNTGSNNSSSNDCLCPKCFFQKFMNKHGNLFTRGQMRALSSPNQQAASSNSGVVFNNSSDASVSHDGAVPNNASSRHLQEQFNEANGRQEKGTCRSQVQPEPVGQSHIQGNPKSIEGDKIVVSNSEVGLSSGMEGGIAYTFPLQDDEDVCPTCLEEYTQENPKIIAKCSHHYHLSCIYEWMERSENCPACRELMLFDESS
ncbi:hypothetical protein Pfo_009586 [Paulownia fortunei]|nr:hypothetical protein Pfo_009586 [Paulownia fortunei]